jgi:hypothetical protein
LIYEIGRRNSLEINGIIIIVNKNLEPIDNQGVLIFLSDCKKYSKEYKKMKINIINPHG